MMASAVGKSGRMTGILARLDAGRLARGAVSSLADTVIQNHP
jgi:hypothetical protein